jgi:hypothetical protein
MKKKYSMPEIVITSFEADSCIMISAVPSTAPQDSNSFGTIPYSSLN